MKLSIITTVYKAENDLPRLLNSMMAQQSRNLEFYLIVNGSPDRSGEICEEYARRDPRFKVVTLSENIGYIRARNYGLEHCDADFVGFCDSDDFLEPGGYDRAMEIIGRNDCDLYLTAYNTISGEKVVTTTMPYDTGIYTEAQIADTILPPAFGVDHRKSMLHGFMWKEIFRLSIIRSHGLRFDESLKPYEDQIFNIDFLKVCRSVYVDDSVIYNYIVSPNSITGRLGAEMDIAGEWCRASQLFAQKKERAEKPEELRRAANTAFLGVYSMILGMSKTDLSPRQISRIIADTFDRRRLSEILKESSRKLSKELRLTRFLLSCRCYALLVRIMKVMLGKR